MNVGSAQGARLDPWDRSPGHVCVAWGAATTGPHAFVTRSTYTVATGNKAMLQSAHARILRDGANGGAAGWATLAVEVRDQTPTSAILCEAMLYTTAVGTADRQLVGYAGVIAAGSAVRITSADGSAAGTCSYNATFVYTRCEA